ATLLATSTSTLFWIISSASPKLAALITMGFSTVIAFFAGLAGQIMFLLSSICLAMADKPNDKRPRNTSLFQLIGSADSLCSRKTSSQAAFNSGVITV